jgi:hypothetical protein
MSTIPNSPNSPTPPNSGSAASQQPGGSAADAFDELEKLVAAAKEDYQKAVGGNKAAGTRVRKSMQDIKQQAQNIRVKVLETRSTTP